VEIILITPSYRAATLDEAPDVGLADGKLVTSFDSHSLHGIEQKNCDSNHGQQEIRGTTKGYEERAG